MRAGSFEVYLAACERLYLEAALRRFDGRVSDTAKPIGISRKNLWEKMRRHALNSHGGTDKNAH
jgi:DNA-binding NtrC family response regulator